MSVYPSNQVHPSNPIRLFNGLQLFLEVSEVLTVLSVIDTWSLQVLGLPFQMDLPTERHQNQIHEPPQWLNSYADQELTYELLPLRPNRATLWGKSIVWLLKANEHIVAEGWTTWSAPKSRAKSWALVLRQILFPLGSNSTPVPTGESQMSG